MQCCHGYLPGPLAPLGDSHTRHLTPYLILVTSSNIGCNAHLAMPHETLIHYYCFAEAGQVFAWGNNEYSQLGLETTEEQVTH